jgi:hypothetical protein
MSFNYNKKPSLVPRDVLKYVNHKTKQKYIDNKMIQEKQEIKTKEIEYENKPWFEKAKNYIWTFMKENYGFVILVVLICLLLFIRYIECIKRKQKIKEIVDKYSYKKSKKPSKEKEKDKEKDNRGNRGKYVEIDEDMEDIDQIIFNKNL